MTVTNNIYQKQIKYRVFNAVTNSELTELVPVFTTLPAFLTSVKKVNTSFKNVWRTWGPALPTLLADLMICCPLGPIGSTNFKNSALDISYIFNLFPMHLHVCKGNNPCKTFNVRIKVRDRPFNLKGWVLFFSFVQKIFFGQHKS
jgi:hypothetical protein